MNSLYMLTPKNTSCGPQVRKLRHHTGKNAASLGPPSPVPCYDRRRLPAHHHEVTPFLVPSCVSQRHPLVDPSNTYPLELTPRVHAPSSLCMASAVTSMHRPSLNASPITTPMQTDRYCLGLSRTCVRCTAGASLAGAGVHGNFSGCASIGLYLVFQYHRVPVLGVLIGCAYNNIAKVHVFDRSCCGMDFRFRTAVVLSVLQTMLPLVMTTFAQLVPSAQGSLQILTDVACSTGVVGRGCGCSAVPELFFGS